jgi:hypothetical protein
VYKNSGWGESAHDEVDHRHVTSNGFPPIISAPSFTALTGRRWRSQKAAMTSTEGARKLLRIARKESPEEQDKELE